MQEVTCAVLKLLIFAKAKETNFCSSSGSEIPLFRGQQKYFDYIQNVKIVPL